MATKCKFKNGMQVFSGSPQIISVGGNVTSTQQVLNTLVETVVLTETIYANTIDATSMSFRVYLGGEISANAGSDITFALRYGTTTIVQALTVTLAAEDDKPFKVEFTGHVLSATKVRASGFISVWQGTPMYFAADTAIGGTTVDMTVDGSLNVTGEWDASSANSDVIVTHGWIEFYN